MWVSSELSASVEHVRLCFHNGFVDPTHTSCRCHVPTASTQCLLQQTGCQFHTRTVPNSKQLLSSVVAPLITLFSVWTRTLISDVCSSDSLFVVPLLSMDVIHL